ncbi:MAG: AraC family transcriptional regulator [Bacteroidales bacterium]|nr:AraC family transcriptional regulator [Bacteroidales bacterium]
MKNNINPAHPIAEGSHRIKEDGIAVFHNVRRLPTDGEPLTSPDYVICIVHRGTMELLYDDMPDRALRGLVAVIFPNHKLTPLSTSSDFCNTVIVVDEAMVDEPLLQVIHQFQYRYEPAPSVHLDEHDYRALSKISDVMHEISLTNMPERRLLMMQQLGCFLRMLGHYRQQAMGDEVTNGRIGTQYLNMVAHHFIEHRDVAFYADRLCITPKYLSRVVRQETGHVPAHWIHVQVVRKAQELLTTHPEITVQAIADQLGFADQQSFSRYFRRETGLSPTMFRQKNK